LVEYNSVVWSPYRKCDIVAVENVQHRLTKRLPGFAEHSYSKRLSLPVRKLPSLELRRLRFDLIYCYKIIFGLIDIDCTEIRTASVIEGHPYKIYKRHCSYTVRPSFFSERVIDVRNGLSDSVDFSSFVKFKSSVNSLIVFSIIWSLTD